MKHLRWAVTIFCIIIVAASCRKTSFIESEDASLSLSADTLHFDTVFTTIGSVTQSFKIFNDNNQKLRLSNIRLMGGNASPFRINVDGTPGVSFSDVELEANDSVYVFVSVTINPNAANLPFIVQDSILVNYNGNDHFLQLQAFGQNAHFLRNQRITTDSTWNNDLPFVILGNVTVAEDVSLTINKQCRIYAHADAPFIVHGSLRVNGTADSRVVFQGDRLDPEYRDLPASWPGIFFSSTSSNNVLNYTTVKNAYQRIITESAVSATPKRQIRCIRIDGDRNEHIHAVVCLKFYV